MTQFKIDISGLKSLKTTYKQIAIYISILFLIISTFFSCANIQRPGGGPKDSIPPVILNESPLNYSTNFKSKEIILTFDEFIKLTNQFKEFNISPDTETPVQYKVKKKNLVITLPDSLDINTTYTINFGKGLTDYNEGNPIINYNYVFATGEELDSLSISGSVLNAFTKEFDQKKDENIKVLLIPIAQDSIFGKRKANIYTNLDTAGRFQFNNLKEDTYRIYALKEQNNDRIYNGTDEWIGFLKDSLVLAKNIENIHLEISKGYPKDYRTLEKKLDADGSILLTFNKSLHNPSTKIIFPEELNDDKIEKYNYANDSLRIYIQNTPLDSIKIEIADNLKIIDTTIIRINKNAKFDRNIKPILNITNKVDRIKHITLTALIPIDNVDKAKILLNEDSVSRRNFQLQRDTINDQIYHIRFNWRPNKNYELIIQENAITSHFQDFNKEFKSNFTLDQSDNYGNIQFTVNGLDSAQQYIAELINEQKDKVFDRQILNIDNNKIIYKNFQGGKYTLRIIYDTNKNKRWDPADVYKGTQAEHIWYLNKIFTIRANWEQEDIINLE